jgi:hypothetical protein
MGRNSSIGIATRYGLDGPGIESRLGRYFPHPSRPAQGPTQWVPCLSRGYSGRTVALTAPPPASPDVKERVELYLYSPSGASWPVIGWALPLPLWCLYIQTCVSGLGSLVVMLPTRRLAELDQINVYKYLCISWLNAAETSVFTIASGSSWCPFSLLSKGAIGVCMCMCMFPVA